MFHIIHILFFPSQYFILSELDQNESCNDFEINVFEGQIEEIVDYMEGNLINWSKIFKEL